MYPQMEPMYIKQQLTESKRQIGHPTIIDGSLKTVFSIMYRTYRQKIIKKIELNNTTDKVDLADVYIHSIKQQHNSHSSQVHLENSPE